MDAVVAYKFLYQVSVFSARLTRICSCFSWKEWTVLVATSLFLWLAARELNRDRHVQPISPPPSPRANLQLEDYPVPLAGRRSGTPGRPAGFRAHRSSEP